MVGLNATELAAVAAELAGDLAAAEVSGCARLAENDDLLLFLRRGDQRRALHIAPGGARARLCTTRRRFGKSDFASGPQIAALEQRLVGAHLQAIRHTPGERCCELEFARDEPASSATVAIELFGPRGFWCVLDRDRTIAELSRPMRTRTRTLLPGSSYTPPPAVAAPATPAQRFPAPVNDAIDQHFTELDRATEHQRDRQRIERALSRAIAKLRHRLAGLERQQHEIAGAGEMRLQADALLAYGFGHDPRQTVLVTPHPGDSESELRIPLKPGVPIQAQAAALYRRARKLTESAVISAQRHATAAAELESLETAAGDLAAAADTDLAALAADLAERGILPARRTPAAPSDAKLAKATRGENYRRFTSAEGYPILVGRNNAQNDKLSVRVARGNDLWFHVGRGHAGSHVVIRLPRNKTASLESMLDAGTLAIHFSKARGAGRADVIYTPAKYVSKPKGLPPGRVTVERAKTLTVDMDPGRLHRLLENASGH